MNQYVIDFLNVDEQEDSCILEADTYEEAKIVFEKEFPEASILKATRWNHD